MYIFHFTLVNKMACNGNNHPPGCQCGFRGGHRHSTPPRIGKWGRIAAKKFQSGPNALCPECGVGVWWIGGAHGGGFYSDDPGPPWTKHPCTNASRIYTPYNKKGRPKLKNRLSTFERGGWLPLIVKEVEFTISGTIVIGLALDNPTTLSLGILSDVTIDRFRPSYFRRTAATKYEVELNCFNPDEIEPTSFNAFDDCKNEMDFTLRLDQS